MVQEPKRVRYSVQEGKYLIIGDLHLTNRNRARHRCYEEECRDVINKLTNIIADLKPKAIFLLGDIFGYDDTILSHSDFYATVLNFFVFMKIVTHNKVFAVRGNHDHGSRTEFSLFMQAGFYKNPLSVDIKDAEGDVIARFHLVNYGDEELDLEIKRSDGDYAVSNVVLGHNDYAIEGLTDWYNQENPLYVKDLKNMKGIDLIISGHIHQGSDIMQTSIGGSDIELLYPGSPSRAAARDSHDACNIVIVKPSDFNSKEIVIEGETLELIPYSEVMVEDDDTGKSVEVNDEETVRRQNIQNLIADLSSRRSTQLDVMGQIDVLPYFSDKAKDKARKVYQEAKNEQK